MFVSAICLCLYAASTANAVFLLENDEFMYTINNPLRTPHFLHATTFTIEQHKPFIGYMRDAVMTPDNNFNSFQVNFSYPFGYLVNSVNGALADFSKDQSCWSFANQSGRLTKGIGTYMPHPGENIILKLTIDSC